MCVRVSSFIFCLTSLCLQEAADDNSVYRNEVHHSLHQGRALHQVSTQRSCLLPGPITIADQMAEEAMVSIIFHNSLLMVFEFPSNKDTLIASETRRFFICKHRKQTDGKVICKCITH
ncbi:unnamed protein product [Brassica rapa subsp. narinosa]